MRVPNFVTVLGVRLRMVLDGLAALYQLPAAILKAKGSGLKEKAQAAFQDPLFQRRGFRLLRAFLPNLCVTRKLFSSTVYPNNGTALVTRHDDVIEVLDRNADFEVVYEPRMRLIAGGENFFLGMQDTALYARDVSNMRLAVRRDDVAATVEPLARRLAEKLVAEKTGRIDVPPQLSLPVPTAIVTDYFGVTGAPGSDFMDWATLMFRYLFTDLRAIPRSTAKRSTPRPPAGPSSMRPSSSARHPARGRTTCSDAASSCRRPGCLAWTIEASAAISSGS